jgi:hypothetical protein
MAFPWDLAVSAGLPLVGGLFGGNWLEDDNEGGRKDYTEALNEIKAILPPEISDQIVEWTDIEKLGVMPIIQQAAVEMPGSALAKFFDPEEGQATQAFQDAGTKGLEELRAIAEGGFTTADQAAMEEIRRRVASQEKGQRDAILQGAQERGVGGSGLEMASNLMAQQSAADRRALENLMTAARGEERRMGASRAGAELGSALRGQEFGERQAVDEADRLINQFNAQMRMRKSEGDAARFERQQASELAEARRIQDLNAQRNYEAALRNANLYQQKFQNQMAKGQAMMGAYGGQAGASEKDLDRRYKLFGSGIGGAGQIMGDYYSNQRKQKDDRDYYGDYNRFRRYAGR